MMPWLVRNLLLPLHERLRGRDTLREAALLGRLEASPGLLGRIRHAKLMRLLLHCRHRVPFYRDRLGAPSAAELRALASEEPGRAVQADLSSRSEGLQHGLEAFPSLEREDIRRDPDALLAEGFTGRLMASTTGGSSGRPLQFWTDACKEVRHNAQKLRFRQWFGVRAGDRQVDFWGSPIELGKSSHVRRLKDRYLLNQALCSAHDLTPQRLEDYARLLGRFRPHLIYGYPTVIGRVARLLAADPDRFGGWRPQAVICTSEMLFPEVRAAIQAGLHAPVGNEYGSRDAGLTAHECPHGRLHIAAEHVWVEVDPATRDDDGVGDLLITNLDGWGMPFVRYRVGDRGRLSDERCPCGSPLPVLDRLEGRRNDFLVGGGGRRVHGSAANYVLRQRPEVAQYRLVQRPDLSLDVQVVVDDGWGEAVERSVAIGLRQALGLEAEVRVERVEVIPASPSGKYRWVESEALPS